MRLRRLALPAGILLVLAVFAVCLCTGVFAVPPGTVGRILLSPLTGDTAGFTAAERTAVLGLRLPRTLAAALVGAALALAGAAYQSMFANPMVSPDILGVTSGASVGASAAILIGAPLALVQLGAFAGGVVAVALTVGVAALVRSSRTTVLVLAGIVVGGFAGSLMSLVRILADPETTLAEITYWTMGSFARASLDDAAVLAPLMVLTAAVLVGLRHRMNVLSLGAREAATLGVDVTRLRVAVIVLSTLLAACSVCLAGPIGWVGLVVPHVARLIVGADNARVMPLALAVGAVFMMLVDLGARGISVHEFPVSMLTGLIGAPFFAVVLVRNFRRHA